MTTVICLGCLLAFAIGTAFRFTMLSHGLARVGWLPSAMRRWLYGMRR